LPAPPNTVPNDHPGRGRSSQARPGAGGERFLRCRGNDGR
jgi:hypothetical protein